MNKAFLLIILICSWFLLFGCTDKDIYMFSDDTNAICDSNYVLQYIDGNTFGCVPILADSNLSGFVPYTGATSDVNLGSNITANNLSGTNTGDQVGDGVTITGTGTIADPFVAEAGSSTIADLTDVDLTDLADDEILRYNSTSEKWENVTISVLADDNYLRLDTSNDPLTGNLEISKADPEIRLTDSGNGEYTRITKSDTLNEASLLNRITWTAQYGIWTKYDNTIPSVSDTTSTNGRIPLGTNGKGDDVHVHSPSVIKDGETYKIWYMGYDGSTYRIYYVTSPDGLTWTKYDNTIPSVSDTTSTNGRIGLGTSGTGDDVHVSNPIVIKDGETYKMWYTGYDGSTYRIYYATSPDGLTWTKYDNTIPSVSDTTSTNGRIPPGTNGKGDGVNVSNPIVIKDGETYKMWYTGYDGSINRIYYATSPDGLTWTKYDNTIPSVSDTTSTNGRIPLGTNGKGDDAHVSNSSVIKDGETYKMWYGASDGSTYRIYYVTSPDGLNWTKYDNTIPSVSDTTSTNGRIPLGTNGKGDDVHVSNPIVIKDGETYKMWYTGYDGSVNRIYYATSPDTSNTKEIQVISSKDSVINNEKGIQTFGDEDGRTVIEGQSTRFNNQGVEQFQIDTNGDLVFPDNQKTYFGTAKDASIYYDGTNLLINPKEVGSGATIFTGNVGIGTTAPSVKLHVVGDGVQLSATTGYANFVTQNATATAGITLGYDATNILGVLASTNPNSGLSFYTNNGTANIERLRITSAGDIKIPADSKKLYFGAGDDASITYDGTNLLINPKEVGAGVLDVTGQLNVRGLTTVKGNVLFNGGAGTTSNMIYLESTTAGKVNGSLGFFAAGVGSSNVGHGPYFLARGNLYSDIASQRGTMFFSAGSPTTALDGEGSLRFYTGLTSGDAEAGRILFTTGTVDRLKILRDGSIKILGDNQKIYFGAGDDASITYDGTNMVINPKDVGSGRVSILAGGLTLPAGSTTAGTSPLKFTSGNLLSTAEAGAIEFLTDDYYATITTQPNSRKGIVLNNGTNLVSGRVPFATTNGRLTDSNVMTFDGNGLHLDANIFFATGKGIIYSSIIDKSSNVLEQFSDPTKYADANHDYYGKCSVNYSETVLDKYVDKNIATKYCEPTPSLWEEQPDTCTPQPPICETKEVCEEQPDICTPNPAEEIPQPDTCHEEYTIVKEPVFKTVNKVGYNAECRTEQMASALSQLNKSINLTSTGIDTTEIFADSIYTKSKVPDPLINYCKMINDANIYNKAQHYAYKLVNEKYVLDAEYRWLVLEGCEKQKLAEMCIINKKYSWCK